MDNLQELQLLLDKVHASEELVARCEAFYETHHRAWRSDVASYFLDFIMRKRDQIHYEWHRVYHMGARIAQARAKSIAERVDI